MSRACVFSLPAILFILLTLHGCATSKSSQIEELKNFDLLYFNTQAVLQKPPTQWDQVFRLVDVPDLKEDYDRLTRFKDAGYIIVWGVDAKSATADATVLCYSEAALTDGGPVLSANGSVIELSAAALTNSIQAAH